MKRLLLRLLPLCAAILPLTIFAQDDVSTRLQTANEFFESKQYDTAESVLQPIVNEYPDYGAAWDLLGLVRYGQYDEAEKRQEKTGRITIQITGEDGKDLPADLDSTAQKLVELFAKVDLPKIAYSKFVYTLRKATAVSNDASKSSALLRIYFVDVAVDTHLLRTAYEHFQKAEDEYGKRNYSQAAEEYSAAIKLQPDYYKARLYLGDCYYFTQNYGDAIATFKEMKGLYPFLLEPVKYLTDAYAKVGQYDDCTREAVHSLSIYPDVSMFNKLDDALRIQHKYLDIKWIPRQVVPGEPLDTVIYSGRDINQYYEQPDMDKIGPWKYYLEAKKKIMPYCDSTGMLRSNPLTKSKYLEVYCWEEMLRNSKDASLDEARRMQKANDLDCYVFITCFHFDCYSQFRQFSSANYGRILAYIKKNTKSK